MGVLTDIVIARPDEAEAISRSEFPAESWPTLAAAGLNEDALEELYGIISGAPWQFDLGEAFPLVAEDEGDGPWVFQFHDDVLNAIAAIPASKTAEFAAAWALTEELEEGGLSAEEAADFIKLLGDHARKARSSGLALFLWSSL